MNKHVHNLDDKLAVLRESDLQRKWYSLDDQRICILCERLISGRMIDIWRDGHGTYVLHCPTPNCASTPRDWFYHGSAQPSGPKVFKGRAPVPRFGLSPKFSA